MVDSAPGSSPEDEQTYEFAIGEELRGERATKGKTLLDVQRDLRIQALYIAAIEDGNVDAFPNPGFIPGYIRSYSRYLSLDPDVVYKRFCAENDFSYGTAQNAIKKVEEKPGRKVRPGAEIPSFQPKFPLSETRRSIFSDINLPAIGSLVVLLGLIGGLGYGGWIVLQNIQRVQFAPVEELPTAVAEVPRLEAPESSGGGDLILSELAEPVSSRDLSDLYRQQELEVPILVPRDGPIASINPDRPSPQKIRPPDPKIQMVSVSEKASMRSPADVVAEFIQGPQPQQDSPAVPEIVAARPLAVIAERAAWVRVYLSNGTVIFEQILEKGESYTPPDGVGEPLIWAGNAGSVYVRIGDSLHGPLGRGTRAVRDVVLEAKAITENYEPVENIPKVISQTFAPSGESGGVAIQ